MWRFLLRIWRWLRSEIVFGFLIATVFWVGILGWQAAYAPTDAEKQKCYEAAQKAGHKSEECKTLWERTTSDPVAFFTFWLVVFTGGLGVSTVMLWRAGERQRKLTRKTSLRQLRAYIHVTRVEVRDFLNAAEYFIQYENRGQTPAYNIETSNCIALETIPVESDLFDRQLGFSKHGTLGPGGQTHFKKPGPRQLTTVELAGLDDGSLAVWVFGEIRYVDAFGKPHTTTYRNLITRDAPLSSDGKMGMAEQGNDAN